MGDRHLLYRTTLCSNGSKANRHVNVSVAAHSRIRDGHWASDAWCFPVTFECQ